MWDDKSMRGKSLRVLGPYRNGGKWRLVVFEDGGRKALLADSQDEAVALKARLLRLFEDRSRLPISAALDEWLSEKRQAGLRETSLSAISGKLRPFLPLDATLGEITPQRAARMYAAETQRQGRFGTVQAASHHKVLRSSRALFDWAVQRGYIASNPFANIRTIGRARAGKAQLRQDEAKKLNDLAIARAQAGDEQALAILVQLVMGLRSSEVLGLRVRDLDAAGTVLVIDGQKTHNARRSLSIESAPLRALLARHCQPLRPEQLIFGADRAAPYHTDRLFKALRRLCAEADIPQVCPHSLRGLHSSLAVARGASSRFVAEALGHGSDAITKRHYIAPDALAGATVKRVAEALTDAPPRRDLEPLHEALRSLSSEELEALFASVRDRR
jgi:integrase